MSSRFMKAGLAATVAGLGVFGLAAQASAKSCDRACLIKTTNDYIAALVAHDPGKAPLAKDVMTVENVKAIKPGEGLWKTASGGPTQFKIYVPDVTKQQAGFLGVIQQSGKPVMLALRLKLSGDGKIVQAEQITAAPGNFPGAKENV